MPDDDSLMPLDATEASVSSSDEAYVPVEEIPLEWRPPEFSPRLKTYAEFPIEMLSTIAASLGRDNLSLTLAIGETTSRIAVCWTRLKQSYLDWFEPMGPPGRHAHIHYRSPQDTIQRSLVQSSMVVDYEAALIFLDVAFDLTAQAVGKFIGRPMSWQQLLAEAEKPDTDRDEWLAPEVARSIRQIQRTVLYARNKAVAHPGSHFVSLRTDETGNVTYLRIPVEKPGSDVIVRLEALSRFKLSFREGVKIDASIVEASGDAVPPWLVITWLDKIAGDLNSSERIELQQLRELVGYSLPSVREIAETSDTLLSGLVQYFGDRVANRITQAAADQTGSPDSPESSDPVV